ncbi:hypothetical protein [Saccharopolyspora rosea]|uniref:Uncharacterized protein n=1 Tax=Saccharopolyspora rosea TaxID=524884 RepID=A0ABW3FKA8_9PSEU|nr:hypothetical protein [Saccharopolyspora rosea]
MAATLFGLAAKTEAGEPDPDRVRVWGMEIPDGAVLFWKEGERSQFALFDTAADAEARFGALFDLVLFRP